MSQQVDNFRDRIIPQCYSPANFQAIKKMGYKNIIWSLYRWEGSDQNIMDEASEMDGLFAVTMPPFRARSGLAHKLLASDIPSYVHTINISEQLDEYVSQYGITEVYSDFLSPIEGSSNRGSREELVETSLDEDCVAKYSIVEGLLYVPCMSMPDSSNPRLVYELHLHIYTKAPEMIFHLNSYTLKSK